MKYLIYATFAAALAALTAAPAEAEEKKRAELKIGLAGGGAPGLLFDVPHVRRTTTEKVTGVLHLRFRMPRVSPRTLELYVVNANGFGLNIKNDDFTFRNGRLRVHLLDVGLFYNARKPVTVSRVERKLDLTLGFGLEHRFSRSWSWTLDARIFFPADVFKLLTDYGDFSRLVGYEALQGGQTWLGVMYCF